MAWIVQFRRFSFDCVKISYERDCSPLTQNSQCAMMHKVWLGGVSYCGYYIYPRLLYTLSVLRHPNVIFRKERVYSPCSVLFRESLDIG